MTITKKAVVDESGNITTEVPQTDSIKIAATYSQDAIDSVGSYAVITIPVELSYDAFNNTSSEFENPVKSNVATGNINLIIRDNPTGYVYNFKNSLDDKKKVTYPYYRNIISKQDVLDAYDGKNDNEVTYHISWTAMRGIGQVDSMIMYDQKTGEEYGDQFDENCISSYLKTKKIYFTSEGDLLAEDGEVKVYDNDTNELIKTFSYNEISKYTSASNAYQFETPIEHIRIETTKANQFSDFTVGFEKVLDIESLKKDYSREDIENVQYISTRMTGVCIRDGEEIGTVDSLATAEYISDLSRINISLSKNTFSNQENYSSQNMEIKVGVIERGNSPWVNGQFIVEMPKEIISMEVNNVKSTNSNVEVVGYDLYKENGQYFLKIITSNENPETFNLNIDYDLVVDPRISSCQSEVKVYGANEYYQRYFNETADIYDVDSDLDEENIVGTESTKINFVSPTSLITMETISNYNDNGDITVAPNVAEFDKSIRTATVNINLTNNYNNVVSEIKILGKVPVTGNKYVINKKDLGSTFDTTMTADGIKIPDEYKDLIDVYYSDKDNVTEDYTDASNNWKTKDEVTDFSTIKSYVIVFKDVKLSSGTGINLSYDINLPEGLDYNDVTYSTHAVFYELATDDGTLALSTEPNRVGIRIVRKFDFNLTKYKVDTKLVAPGNTYLLEELSSDGEVVSSRIGTTSKTGDFSLKDLYIGMNYKLKEIKTSSDYQLNDDVIEFVVNESAEDSNILVANITSSDGFAEEPVMAKSTDNKDTMTVTVEDEPKIDLQITKKSSGKAVKDIVFMINESGTVATSDSEGKLSFTGLLQNQEYTLSEIDSGAYYEIDDIKFKVIKDGENYKLECTNSAVSNINVVNDDTTAKIQVSFDVENEKIPTYNLEVLKVEDTDNLTNAKSLAGAKFELRSDDTNFSETFVTDENGKINVSDLYAAVAGKSITGLYHLQELEAPAGYANDAEMIDFIVTKDATGNLSIEVQNESNLDTLVAKEITDSTLKLTIADKPMFKLVKFDADSRETLQGVEFVIYSVDSDNNIVDFAKDLNGNYIGTQNADGYYVVTTDKNGTITEPLPDGKYCILELATIKGYEDNNFVYYFNVGEDEDESSNEDEYSSYVTATYYDDTEYGLEINNIEDLVDLSNYYNSARTSDKYSDKYDRTLIKLNRDLDFNDGASYKDATSTAYGDLNGDGTVQILYEELTTGSGFIAIGNTSGSYNFNGTFDGQGYTISNLYQNGQKYGGLFGYTKAATFKNLTVTGQITEMEYAGAIVAYASGTTKIENCVNQAKITSDDTKGNIGGILGGKSQNYIFITNCRNEGEIESVNYAGGIVGDLGLKNPSTTIYNCTNTAKVSGKYACGIFGYGYGNVIECSNSGDIFGKNYAAGICDTILGTTDIINCSNSGNIYCEGTAAGGIVAYAATYVSGCYNTGKVTNTYGEAGGIAGHYVATVENSYNRGTIIGKHQVGGIAPMVGTATSCFNEGDIKAVDAIVSGIGYSGTITDCYNDGDISLTITAANSYSYADACGIGGMYVSNCIFTGEINYDMPEYIYNITDYASNTEGGTVTNSYYTYDETEQGAGTKVTDEELRTKEFYNALNVDNVWVYTGVSHPKLNVSNNLFKMDGTTLNVDNNKEEYKITTDIDESNGCRGGSISGEDEVAYEYVTYLESNAESIVITPLENFYIAEIKVNDKNINFVANSDGSYTIPAGYFTNMDEDKNVVVRFTPKTATLKIKKVDKNDTSKVLQGAVFNLKEIEDYRSEITAGEPINNNTIYVPAKGKSALNNVLGTLEKYSSSDTKYMVENSDGTINLSEASTSEVYSYKTLDLTGYTGKFVLKANVTCSTSTTVCNIYVNDDSSKYSTDIKVCATAKKTCENQNFYTIAGIEGGKTYYIRISGYSSSAATDLTINSIDVYPAGEMEAGLTKTSSDTYETNIEEYVNASINSDIPIDLTNEVGSYTLDFDVENLDESTTKMTTNVIQMDSLITSGQSDMQLYSVSTIGGSTSHVSVNLSCGRIYYIKNIYTNLSYDNTVKHKVIIKNIKLTPELINVEGTTDENGIIEFSAPAGKYELTELEAPMGYVLDDETKNIEVKAGQDNTITVTNSTTPEKVKITTAVDGYRESDSSGAVYNVKGGSIDGDGLSAYERVAVGSDNTLAINMVPDAGYTIAKVTVNGEKIVYTVNSDGSATIPAGYFTNMTEDKEVVVSFVKEDELLKITKVDSSDNTKGLAGAKFEITQVEQSDNLSSKIGSLTRNGDYQIDLSNHISRITDEATSQISSYKVFTSNDGVYIPSDVTTASKYNRAYLTFTTGSEISYLRLDMNVIKDKFPTNASLTVLVDGVSVYNNESGNNIIFVSKALSANSSHSITITYYNGKGTTVSPEELVKVNSIDIYGGAVSEYFNEVDGKYISNNSGIDATSATNYDSTALSYIPIDLTNCYGTYKLTVNAEVSSEKYGDYGFLAVNQNTNKCTNGLIQGKFANLSGEVSAQDYTVTLEGGSKYYLHLGYMKNASVSSGSDRMVVNSVKLELDSSALYSDTVETGSDGVAYTALPQGNYVIKEIQAPDGYLIDNEETTVTMVAGSTNEITITDSKKAVVNVHYYVKGTGEEYGNEAVKLADDVELDNVIGQEYTSDLKVEIGNYSLEKDSAGEYIVPENASGKYTEDEINVYYYYVKTPVNVTVHRYLNGTTTKLAEDEITVYEKGDTYSVTNATDIFENYDFVNSVGQTEGTIAEDIEVIYYYDVKDAEVIVHHLEEVTNATLAPDETVSGKVFEEYETKESSSVPANYAYSSKTENWKGTMTADPIEVTYYYKKTPFAVTPGITLDAKVTDLQDRASAVPYVISYNAVIKDYIGDAKITIVDTLPYEIDEASSTLAGGVYDATNKTITWEISVKDIDTYEEADGEHKVIINKAISLLYKDVDEMADTITNTASGTIEMNDTTKTVSDTADISDNLPGHLVIKYIDIYSNEEISTQTKHDELVGTEFDVSSDKKDIDGYTLAEEPAVKTGKYVKGTTEKIYYYAKNATLRVEHIDKLTNAKLEEDTVTNGKENDAYSTVSKTFEGYKVDETSLPTNASGTLAVTKNSDGTYNRETIVKYYYIHNAVVNEKHIDIITNKELATATTNGYEGDDYEIKSRSFAGYDLVSTYNGESKSPTNAKGTMTRDGIDVTYYYIRPAKVIVKHIDKATNKEIADSETISGHQNDTYTTASKSIDNYILVETPDNKNGSMTVTVDGDGNVTDTIYVTYVYSHVSAGIIEKHIDIETNDILYNEVHEGNEGDTYKIDSKSIDGFELVETYNGESKLPTNSEGTMTIDPITVTYYYRRPAKVTVNYIDSLTGEKLTTSVTKEGYQNEKYTTEEKSFTNYKLSEKVVDEPGNSGDATGKMLVSVDDKGTVDDETVVNYYYIHSAKVVENHIDLMDDSNILYTETHSGYEGDLYDIDSIEYNSEDTTTANFEGFDLVEETVDTLGNKVSKLPENAEGTMTRDTITVNYYYIKKTMVTANYIDIMTGEKVATSDVTEGHEGDEYSTEEKEIDEYEIVKEFANEDGTVENKYPENIEGTMTKAPIDVNYYYIKKTSVVARYFDILTHEELTEAVVTDGLQGDEYTTDEKSFDMYQIVPDMYPANVSGKMSAEPIYVDYYYIRPTTVRVKFVDKLTGKSIIDDVVISGFENDKYSVDAKSIDGYKLLGDSSNISGVMKVTQNSDGTYSSENEVVFEYLKEEIPDVAEKISDIPEEIEKIDRKITSSIKTGDSIVIYIAMFVIGSTALMVAIRRRK